MLQSEIMDMEVGRGVSAPRFHRRLPGVDLVDLGERFAGHCRVMDTVKPLENHGSMRDALFAFTLSIGSGLASAFQIVQGVVSVAVGLAAVASAYVAFRRFLWDQADRKRRKV